MRRRICIDIRITQKSSRFTGTGIYAERLSQALLIAESITEFDFFFLALKGHPIPFSIPKERLILVSRPNKPESFREIFDVINLKGYLRRHHIALFHSLVPGLLRSSPTLPVVVTVHDIIPDLMPQESYGSRVARWLYKIRMITAERAKHILANSDATKNDLITHYRIQPEKISTVYLGAQFVEDSKCTQETSKYNRERPFLLYLGGFNFRKNVGNIFMAFSKAINKYPNLDLLIAGKPPKLQFDELIQICEELNLTDRIVWLGFVQDKDLPILYRKCEAFLYPSLYEGFGMPVLEAMRFRAPVITSDRGSIPEIVEDAGIIVDPTSVDKIFDGIVSILENPLIQENMRSKGEIQANKFSWTRCARETLSVYKTILFTDENRD